MLTPVPRPIGEQHEALHHTVLALVAAMEENANPYRHGDKLIDTEALIQGHLQYFMGPRGPSRPPEYDLFSALVGAAMALGITITRGSTDWITKPPQ